MAISKILYIGDCGAGYSGKHLKQAIGYISEREKTGEGKWISTVNCQQDHIYEQMRSTKEQYGKTDKRQGYHLIISFKEGEVNPDTAFEIIGKFAKEYLGKDYEGVYTIHDNTAHVHGHIIFNSVSFRTGKKFRYEKGDWGKYIQPITNRLCKEYGLSVIEIEEDRAKASPKYPEWKEGSDGRFLWGDMIKRDLDACILQVPTYDSFLSMLKDMGYEVKNAFLEEGKHLAIKPMGMNRFRRCSTLGEEYSREHIIERIARESLADYQKSKNTVTPRIVRCKVKRYRRAALSGLQKKHFSKLYRTGMLKKRPYSQAYKYRNEIRNMQRLQEEYLFLVDNGIKDKADLIQMTEQIGEKKREISSKKRKLFQERARYQSFFELAEEWKDLQVFENCYQKGEAWFQEEHERYMEITGELEQEGYSLDSLESLKEHYQREIGKYREWEKQAAKKERTAKNLLREIVTEESGKWEKEKSVQEEKMEKVQGKERGR